MIRQPTVKVLVAPQPVGDLVVAGCFAGVAPSLGVLERRFATTAARAIDRPGWRAATKQIGRAASRGAGSQILEIHGLGPKSAFDARELDSWLHKVLERARSEGVRELTVVLPAALSEIGVSSARVARAVLSSNYRFDRFKTKPDTVRFTRIGVVVEPGEGEEFVAALKVARVVERGVARARDLANTPGNVATPEWMADQARKLAAEQSMDCQIFESEHLAEMGMGGVCAVGSGSVHPPRLVRLEWGEGGQVVSLVGKGVTFDTGGVSIKASAGLEEMKFDKSGACTVLGICSAVSELGLPGRFRAYLPFVENMPGGAAYRPGDIIRCFNGKTVEILDTDAEGRLILADALAYAVSERPDTLLEFSTLTGSSVVALGSEAAALYTPDDGLASELSAAADRAGELIWRMPLWPQFTQEMRGAIADLRNLGSRWGGANSAAAFLGEFAGPGRRWAHFDIAGPAYVASRERQIADATGFGVGLTLEWLLERNRALVDSQA